MAFGTGESRAAKVASAETDARGNSGENNAREEAYKSFQPVGNEQKAEANEKVAENPFPAGDPFNILAQANGELEKSGKLTPESRANYKRAINVADAINQSYVASKFTLAEQALQKVYPKEKQNEVRTAEPRKVQEEMQVLQTMALAPALTRFAYAQALSVSGDGQAALPLLEQVLRYDPRFVDDPAFKALARNVGFITDNPYSHVQAADQAATAGNAKTAEREWRKAVAAADALPVQMYSSELQKVEDALKSQRDQAKNQDLLRQKAALATLIDFPATLRVQAADFYLRQAKPAESKCLLDEAAAKNPSIRDDDTYKKLVQTSDKYSPDLVAGTVDILKKSGKEIVSDLGAGTIGLAATSIVAGGPLLKLGAGLLAGGLTKHGLNMAMGVDSPLGKDMVWGGVDVLAFVTGAGVRKSLIDRMETGLGKETLEVLLKDGGAMGLKNLETKEAALLSKQSLLENALAGRVKDPTIASTRTDLYRLSADQLFSRAMTDADKISIKQGLAESLSRAERGALDSVLANSATVAEKSLLEDRVAAFGAQQQRLTLEKSALEQHIAKLTGPNGPIGLDGLSAATELLTEGVAGKREIAAAELKQAVAQAPWWQRPILWSQGHAPLLWRLPNESLAGFQTAQKEFLAARGSVFSAVNPLNAFRSVDELGSLKGIQSHMYWQRYGIDAASVGATSVVLRGSREADKIGSIDPATGKKYSAYDAVTNTAVGSAVDAATGGLVMAGGRSLAGTFTRFSGAAGEINARPALTSAANASAYDQMADSVRLASNAFKQQAYKPIGDFLSALSLSEGSATTRASAAVLTGAGLFSPQFSDFVRLRGRQHEYETVLKEIEKPIVDEHPELLTRSSINPSPYPAPARPVPPPVYARRPPYMPPAPAVYPHPPAPGVYPHPPAPVVVYPHPPYRPPAPPVYTRPPHTPPAPTVYWQK